MADPNPMKPLNRIWWTIQWMALLCVPLLLFWWVIGTLTLGKFVISLVIPFGLLMSFSLIQDRVDRES